jgi:iron complex transport system ATP-binding protein
MIKLNNISIGNSEPLFSIHNLILNQGDLHTVIGKNGTGKSTLLSTLGELIKPLTGEIIWDSSLPKNKRIAFVPSKFEGVTNLSTFDFIAMGRAPYTNIFGKLNSKDYKIVEQIVEEMNLTHLYSKDTTQLSDGERQMACIAKAIVQETELILLDEPTSFLDYENKIKIIQQLKKVASTKNCCIIQSSHDLDISMDFSDKILVIEPIKKELIDFNRIEISKEELIKLAFPNS